MKITKKMLLDLDGKSIIDVDYDWENNKYYRHLFYLTEDKQNHILIDYFPQINILDTTITYKYEIYLKENITINHLNEEISKMIFEE